MNQESEHKYLSGRKGHLSNYSFLFLIKWGKSVRPQGFGASSFSVLGSSYAALPTSSDSLHATAISPLESTVCGNKR